MARCHRERFAFVALLAIAISCPRISHADWGGDGVVAGYLNDPTMLRGPLVLDNLGGLLDVWSTRSGTSITALVQRVTPAGDISPGWPAAGVGFTASGKYVGNQPFESGGIVAMYDAAPDDSAGVFLAFHDAAVPGGRLALDHYRMDGQHDSRWPAIGATVAGSSLVPARVVTDGSGGAIVSWVSISNLNLYAVRIQPDGQPAPGCPPAECWCLPVPCQHPFRPHRSCWPMAQAARS